MKPTVLVTLVSASLLLFACGTAGDSRATANLLTPEFSLQQIGGVAPAARHETGPISVNLQAQIYNPSSETIRLKRIELHTMGAGAYTIRSISFPFDHEVAPDDVGTVDFWVSAWAHDTVMGANGPVTIRATAFFDSSVGEFREVYVRQVNDPMRSNPPR